MARSAGVGRQPLGGAHRTHLDHVAQDLGAELGEEELGERARGHPGGGLAGAGPLEHVAGVVEAVLLHPHEVGVAGPGLVQGLLGRPRSGRHLLLPLRPLGVVDDDGDRGAEGEAVADAAQELDVVALEAHAGAAPEAEAAAGELVTDLVDGDRQARGEPLDDHRQRGAVGLTGGQVTQHADNLRRGRSRIPAGPSTPSLIRPGAPARRSAAPVPVEDRNRPPAAR